MKKPTRPIVELSMASADAERVVTFDLLVDSVGYDLTGTTVECHMTNLDTAAVTTVTDVTADADQSGNPGRCVTEFTAANLAAGVYSLEWEITDGTFIATCPGDANVRPVLTVRTAAA